MAQFHLTFVLTFVCRESFNRVMENMREIGFLAEEVGQILTILAAVLHIGDIVRCDDVSMSKSSYSNTSILASNSEQSMLTLSNSKIEQNFLCLA